MRRGIPFFLILVGIFISLFNSCDWISADSFVSNDKPVSTNNLKNVTIQALLEGHVNLQQTKTSIDENNSVLWNQGDSFSLLYKSTNTTSISVIPYSSISGMAVGSSQKVIITSVARDGYTLGSTGTSWSTQAVSGYTNYGTSLSSANASANESKLISDMTTYYTSNPTKSVFTLKKVSSSSYTLQNSDGNYLSGTGTDEGSATWSSSSMNLSIENATGTSSSSLVVSQNSNPNILRIRNSSGYPLYSSSTPFWRSGQSGGWTLWYMYSVPDVPNNKFTSTSASGTANASFTGSYDTSASDKYYALYPYSTTNYLSDGIINFSMSSEQNYVEGTFADGTNPSVGILNTTDNKVAFKNLMGVLKLSLKSSETLNVTSITVKDNNPNNSLWGDVTVPCSGIDNGIYMCSVTGGDNTLKLNCNGVQLNSTPKDFYLVVPVGSFEYGFSITVDTSSGTFTKSANASNAIARSKIKAMPTLEIGGESLSNEFMIENEIVHDFVSSSYGTSVNFQYSAFSSGGFASRVTSAYNSGNGWRTDHPAVKTIYWTGTASSYIVTITGTDGYNYSETVSTTSYDISGLAPGYSYTYTVTPSGSSTPVLSGRLQTTGQLRMIRIDETWNVRDLGGWHTYSGKTVKYGKLFRGGHLDSIGKVSQNKLVASGVKAELDLRGTESDGGTNYGAGSYAHDDETSLIPNAVYKHFYIDQSRDNPGTYPGLVECVKWAIQRSLEGKPVYFHCKTGADRTGQISVLLLGLLGVTEQDIEKEYETTNFGWELESTGYNRIDRTLPNTYMNYLVPVINACTGDTFQDRCRYYLHNKFSAMQISDEDMDAFIELMLE